MLKIVIAMCIGIAIGAAVTHKLISPGPTVTLAPAATLERASQLPGAQAPLVPAVSGASPVRSGAGSSPIVAGGNLPRVGNVPGGSRTREILAVEATISEAESFADAFARAQALSGDAAAFHTALRVVAQQWLSVAPAEAIAALDSLSVQDSSRRVYIEALARAAAVSQPALLTDIFARLRNQAEQFGIVNAVTQSISNIDDLEPLLNVAALLPSVVGQSLQSLTYMQMLERDSDSALARIGALPAGEMRQRLVMQSVMHLARSDPAAAMQWLTSQPDGFEPMMYQGLATMIGQQAPEIAQQYLTSVPESARGAWVTAAARGIAMRDVNDAINWLDSYRSTAYYDDALAGVVQQMASLDPPRAAQLLRDFEPGSAQALNAVSVVASVWGQTDPDSALAWARGLAAGDARDRALASLAPVMGESMFNDATLDLFSEQRMRDSAVGAVVMTIAGSDRDRAMELIAQHVSNPTTAQEYTQIVENAGQANSVVNFGLSRAIGISPSIGVMPAGTAIFSDVIIAGGNVPQFSVGPNATSGRVIRNVIVSESGDDQ